MKAPLLPARRIGDAVPKTRWLVSSRLTLRFAFAEPILAYHFYKFTGDLCSRSGCELHPA